MIPILYDSSEVAFSSNGLGRLRDCISCKVTEERNGIYECDFEYPVNGAHFDDIIPGRIIGVKPDESNGSIQPFDIISNSKPINNIVLFHAVHISYRQSKLTVAGTNINSLADALTMLAGASPSNPFSYETNKTVSGYLAAADGVPRSVRSILGGVEGSILDAYGGEYEWDRFKVKLLENRGYIRSTTVRYGVNLLDYNDDTNYAEVYNACVPYWSGTDANNVPLIVKGSTVNSGLTSYNGRVECVPLDLTDKFETQPTAAQLEALALSYMTGNQVNLPQQSIKIDFIQLDNSIEYADYSALFNCGLCDIIRVIFPRYGMNGQFKIVKTVYDALLERYESMELGTLSTTLSQALGLSK